MTESDIQRARDFQTEIYPELDRKLKSTPWNGGVSEAHGLLAGLACRGIIAHGLANKMYLLRIPNTENTEHAVMLEGLFDLILRDLQSDEITFNILLPAEPLSTAQKAEQIANWCQGYLQGFCYDGKPSICQHNDIVREIFEDIFHICSIELDTDAELELINDNDDQKSLVEIEEYLRVGIRLIYDETTADTRLHSEPASH